MAIVIIRMTALMRQKIEERGMDTMVHAYNPSHLGGGDKDDCGLRTAHTKTLQDLLSNNKQWGGACLSFQLHRKYKLEDCYPGHQEQNLFETNTKAKRLVTWLKW
jgi:hypothetical protein